MPRNPFGWNLPPGVTNKMIEDAAGGDDYACMECGESLTESEIKRSAETCDKCVKKQEQL